MMTDTRSRGRWQNRLFSQTGLCRGANGARDGRCGEGNGDGARHARGMRPRQQRRAGDQPGIPQTGAHLLLERCPLLRPPRCPRLCPYFRLPHASHPHPTAATCARPFCALPMSDHVSTLHPSLSYRAAHAPPFLTRPFPTLPPLTFEGRREVVRVRRDVRVHIRDPLHGHHRRRREDPLGRRGPDLPRPRRLPVSG